MRPDFAGTKIGGFDEAEQPIRLGWVLLKRAKHGPLPEGLPRREAAELAGPRQGLLGIGPGFCEVAPLDQRPGRTDQRPGRTDQRIGEEVARIASAPAADRFSVESTDRVDVAQDELQLGQVVDDHGLQPLNVQLTSRKARRIGSARIAAGYTCTHWPEWCRRSPG